MLKLACVSYLNALPLTQGLNPQEVEILYRAPAQLRPFLEQSDAALLPILNYFEDESLYLIPGLCIGCKGAVESVKLFSDEAIETVSKIYLDEESRTSQNLLKVILKEKYGRDLQEIEFFSSRVESPCPTENNRQPLRAAPTDDVAALLIGDKAILNAPQTKYVYDLGQEWTEWQKLPFVFAAWMSQKDLGKSATQTLQNSLKTSLANLDLLVDRFADKWDKNHLKNYFSKSINYVLGEDDLKGITRFFELLKPIQGFKHELHFRFVSKD